MQGQFTSKRLIGLGILTAATLGFIIYMQVTYPAQGGNAVSRSEWSRFNGAALICIGIVLLIDILTVLEVRHRNKGLSAEERDPEGAHPDLDPDTAPEAISLNPVMQAAIKHTLAKQSENGHKPTRLSFRAVMDLMPNVLSLQAVPLSAVLITMACSGLLVAGSIYYGFPLWGKALALLIPWMPLFTFEASWKYKHYGFYAFMLVFAVLQVGHLIEHSVQVGQIFVSGGDLSVAHGVFGALDRELVHFTWDSLVWLGVCGLLIILGPHNKWLWIAFVAASFHQVEHLFLYYLDRFQTPFYEAGGTTGILAKGGLIGTPLDRPYLHYIYNFFVVVPLLMAMWDETKRAYNVYLAKALPSLSDQERVAASAHLLRTKFAPGEIIVRQGDGSDRFFIIAQGTVEVVREDEDGGETVLGTLEPGQFFGELGLLMGAPRTATVRARDEVELLAMGQEQFSTLVSRSSGGAMDVDRALPERLAELAARRALD